MNFTFLKKLISLIIAPALLLSFASKNTASFSGEWTLDEAKSDMGQFANIVPRKIKVDQTADSISITKTSLGFTGEEVVQTETLTYDGKETETTAFGTSKRKASAKWSGDGQTLTITYKLMLDFNGQITEISGTEIWTRVDGSVSLSVVNSSSSSFGDNTYKGVYKK